jgi:hypothetical protein
MECVNCGRRNQPTTRFCAECGDVLRSDPPRARRATRSPSRQRKRRVRIHWVRVPPRPRPSILTATLEPSAAALASQQAPERMMRRVDLILAAVVGAVGIAAYIAYPYLNDLHADDTAIASAEPPAASMPMPPLEPRPLPAIEERPAPLAPPSTPPSVAPSASPTLDVVPPRTLPRAPARARAEPSQPRAAPLPPPAAPRFPYAVSTGFGGDVAQAPRVAAAPAQAPVRKKDKLQQMNETIAGCAGDGLLARIACEQRALLAYCDGQWGRNDRCPSGRTADYGN